MTPNEQKKAAKDFVARWKAAEGNEQRESNSYWIELCMNVLGIANPTQHLDFERKVKGRRIDVFYEDRSILIENKSRGIDLDEPEQRGKDRRGNPRWVTPFEQAKWYADNITPRSVMPKWIITCNFDEMRIYDLDREDAETSYETITLDELPDQYHRLSFFTRKENSRLEREKQLSVKAGEVVGKLYDSFSKAYRDIENDEREQRSLNILITRIVFLLFAEDAELLHERDAFYKYLKNFQVNHMRQALIDLFAALKTPKEERDPYIDPDLAAFPYVNGGLFEADIIIPQFTEDTRFILLQEASAEFDWKDISPTIFGAVFESTLNPETRRAGGMHYTSIENIHKLTGPLFYDALKDELTTIEGAATEKERKFKLQAFRQKIASLKFLDPACGSGNFLTETYLSLRKLENRVLENLYGDQMVMGEFDPIQVTVDQFFGIEINDFAVEVAKTALWIAELQMLDETRQILSMWIDPLPLKINDNIHEGNALRMDWNDVVPASECSYVIGNPPFLGYKYQTEQQKDDLRPLYGNVKNIDYVSGWYMKAALYVEEYATCCAFVSTNSITQGEQVKAVWEPIITQHHIKIDFAYRTFVWNSEATDTAHVHCVIVGFSHGDGRQTLCRLFIGGEVIESSRINPYLVDAPDVFIGRRSKALCNCDEMITGSEPRDGGSLIFGTDERNVLIARYPEAAQFVRTFLTGQDYIANKERYCLWLKDADTEAYSSIEPIVTRLNQCRLFREASKQKQAHAMAAHPELFVSERQPTTSFLLIPQASSGNRRYIPVGYMDASVIVSNTCFIVPNASLYSFGIITSQIHMAWMRTVAGRLKSDYRYSNAIVYNNFVWPEAAPSQRAEIEARAQAILDVRAAHPDSSLAMLYDSEKMPSDLLAAHQALDVAVEASYGASFNGDEEKIVAHLFKLYAEKTGGK